jgi:hypothetical protein
MKTLILIASLILSASVSQAGPTISGGVPPHPALTTMAVEKAVAGDDYPTDMAPPFDNVLALYNVRIALVGPAPRLVSAEAGVEYPTDFPPPMWTSFQRVLEFKNNVRIPVRLSYANNVLTWQLKNKPAIDASSIRAIISAQDHVEVRLVDGSRIIQK